ncbi:neural/ectodermal development factor IMP-L2 [Hylaeus volcanicus]|uniref:neural/ectodermal development factor IMP-L2 n=1 Tax=Hylaeus volcanicus TaxID=313075 RepID=UPI0023B7C8B9|nr:neural/ectodermal development factor IMP-L2 [Hylaeus volcanicus]XP_053981961.1 neural/ectodermal development factor IMP-L2 [Hylaeus volcanicus]
MQSSSALLKFVYIIIVSCTVSGHPFSFLPRYAVERAAERRSIGKQVNNHRSNFLTPLAEYGARSAEPKPVEPWTKITQHPVNGIETTVGSRVELECKASGSPPPEILWFTGTGSNEELVDYVTANTHSLYDPSEEWKGVARINSKLVIECVTPDDAGLIYCASVSAREVKVSTPTVLLVNSEESGNSNCSSESDPTITLYSPTRVANIGATVVLPCRASGKPTPEISWVDNFNVPLTLSTNLRHRVLDSGDLLIEELLWEDMGGYTCKAKSGHRQQIVSTFLYPLRPETEVDRTVN